MFLCCPSVRVCACACAVCVRACVCVCFHASVCSSIRDVVFVMSMVCVDGLFRIFVPSASWDRDELVRLHLSGQARGLITKKS